MTGVGSAVLEWLTGGSALAALVKVFLGVCTFVFGLTYRRYLGILGADRRRPPERQAYDALRASLAEGNIAAHLYAGRLTRFLDWNDRFFGDAGMADRTLFPHAFGLRKAAPLWTAAAFDCCLLLAFFYPILAIFIIWTVSGHVGPAERALRLEPSLLAWQRGAAAAGVSCMLFFACRKRSPTWRARLRHLFPVALGFALAAAVDIGTAVIFAVVIVILPNGISTAGSGAGSVVGAIFLAILYMLAGLHKTEVLLMAGFGIATFIVFVATMRLNDIAKGREWQGVFFPSLFLRCY